MKKMNILLVALTLALSAISPMASFADDDSEQTGTQTSISSDSGEETTTTTTTNNPYPNGRQTRVSQYHKPSYTLTIPADTSDLEENDNLHLSMTTFLNVESYVQVKVTSQNTWHLTDEKHTGNDSPLAYKLKVDDKELTKQTETILTAEYDNQSPSVDLVVESVAKAKYAGTYSDVLTFEAEIIGADPEPTT